MQDLKISLITVTYNAGDTIEKCIQSVVNQTFKNIEYIIIDGGSTDDTLQIVDKYKNHVSILISEPDKGIYDAMNKGIRLSSGDVVGTLNADDVFATAETTEDINTLFVNRDADIVYGDLDYIDSKGKVIRKWRSGLYKPGRFNWGWMPPHPTFYCKKELFEKFDYYSLDYGTAADYELMLRFIHQNHVKPVYLEKVMVKMMTGGVSNKNINNHVKGSLFDLKAMRSNGIIFPLFTIVFKPFRKIFQFL